MRYSAENLFILLAGMSGSGKSTVADIVCKHYGGTSIASYTTRPRREGEQDGKGHFFLTEEEFDRIPKEEMIAYTEFDGYRYCATKDQVEDAMIYVVDKAGIEEFREKYNGDKNVLVIFLSLSEEERIRRMKKRGDTPEMIASRIRNDNRMFQGIEDLCDIIIDADRSPEEVAEDIKELII